MRQAVSVLILACVLVVPSAGHCRGGVLVRGWVLDEETAWPLRDAVVELVVDEGGLGYQVYTNPDGSFEVRADVLQAGVGYWPSRLFGERVRGREALTVYGVRAQGWRDGYRYVLSRATLRAPATASVAQPLSLTVYLRRQEPLRRVRVVTNVPRTAFALTVFGTVGRRDGAGVLHVLPAACVLPVLTDEGGVVEVDLSTVFPHERVYGGVSVYNRQYVPVDYPEILEEAGAGSPAGFVGLRFAFRRADDHDWEGVAAATVTGRELMTMAADGVLLNSMRPRFSGGQRDARPLPDFRSPISRGEFFDLALRAMKLDLQVVPPSAAILVGDEAEAVSNLHCFCPLVAEGHRRGLIQGRSSVATVPPGTPYLTKGASVDLGLAEPLTRAEAAAFLLRARGLPVEEGLSHPFADVPEAHWAWRVVATAYRHGIVRGYGGGRFGPDDSLTREQAVLMVYRSFYAGR